MAVPGHILYVRKLFAHLVFKFWRQFLELDRSTGGTDSTSLVWKASHNI